MTDLEKTKLCAEAMGIPVEKRALRGTVMRLWFMDRSGSNPIQRVYDPLHDDAQAMALVKRFDLRIDRERWYAVHAGNDWDSMYFADDLNAAIVECIAKMQAARIVPQE